MKNPPPAVAKKRLRAFFFDVDDTLYSSTQFADTARRHAIQAMIRAGLPMDERTAMEELQEVIEEFGSNNTRHFDMLIQRLPDEVIHPNLRLIIVVAGMSAYHQCKNRDLAPFEDAIEVLRRLRAAGLRLGCITAGVGPKQAEKIVRLNLLPLLDPDLIFITEVAGISKGNPKLFARACRAANCDPAETLYIGDNPATDIDAPARAGMRTILSRREGKYLNVEPPRPPDHVVHNFWDVLEIVENEYEIIGSEGAVP